MYSVDVYSDHAVSCSVTASLKYNRIIPFDVASWESTIMIVGKDRHKFKLQEFGDLDFGIRITKALNLAYHAKRGLFLSA